MSPITILKRSEQDDTTNKGFGALLIAAAAIYVFRMVMENLEQEIQPMYRRHTSSSGPLDTTISSIDHGVPVRRQSIPQSEALKKVVSNDEDEQWFKLRASIREGINTVSQPSLKRQEGMQGILRKRLSNRWINVEQQEVTELKRANSTYTYGITLTT